MDFYEKSLNILELPVVLDMLAAEAVTIYYHFDNGNTTPHKYEAHFPHHYHICVETLSVHHLF